jgi:4-amino-4-deoxy-L-arabinose transferase-like glycosyltransferase
LLAILAVVLVEGLAWTVMVPALQGADEGAHVSYVQEIADDGEIPWRFSDVGLLEREYPPSVSTEQWTAWLYAGLEPLRGNQAARPLWTPVDEAIWRAEADKLGPKDKQNAIGSSAWRNPPLYYLAAAVPYKLAGGSFFDRVFGVRLLNVALLVAIVALTWLLAGELFGRRRSLQAVAAGAVALHPVLLDVSTRVTPDALLAALAASVLYLMALVVRRGPSARLLALLAVALVAAGLTQARAIGLLAPAVFAVALAWWRHRQVGADGAGVPRPRRTGRDLLLWAGVLAAMLVAVAFYATGFQPGELVGFWSYLWQFYLPALPGMSTPIGPEWGAEQVYLDRFFATFVQFEVGLPGAWRDVIRAGVWVGLALLVAAALRHRSALRERRDLVAVLLAALALSVLALHAAAFRELLENPTDPIITGRYLLMLVPLFGLGVAAATTALPGRARALGTGALLAGLVLLQLSAFGEVAARFYA